MSTHRVARRLQELVRQEACRRRQRIRRRLTQFNLKSLFLLFALTGFLCVVGPTLYCEMISPKVDLLLLPMRMRYEAKARLQSSRPVATTYRSERLTRSGDGWGLMGDCLIGGQWYRYRLVYERDEVRRLPLLPLTE